MRGWAALAAVVTGACGAVEPELERRRDALTSWVFHHGVNGYDGTRDTTLRSATPDENRGDQEDLRVGVDTADGTQVGLVRWDVSAVPIGSVVTAAQATFVVANQEQIAVEARPLLRDWVELQATWNRASTAVAWSSPGASGAADMGAPFGQVACTATMCTLALPLPLAQAWVDSPGQNRGLMLRSTSMMLSDFRVWARDELDAGSRPVLRLDVQAPSDGGADGGSDAGLDAGSGDAGAADAGMPADAGASDAGRADGGAAPDAGLPGAGDYGAGCGCGATGPLPLGLLALLLLREGAGLRRRPRYKARP